MNIKEEWANMAYNNAMVTMGFEGYEKPSATELKSMNAEVGKALKKSHPLPEFTKELSAFPVVRNEDGMVSAYQTYQTLPKEHKVALKFVAYFRSRAQLYPDASKASQWGMFTPIFMRAHKEYNNIMYEDWSFDSMDSPELALGLMLWESIHEFREFTPGLDDKIEQLREDMFAQYKDRSVSSLKDLRGNVWRHPGAYPGTKNLLIMKAQLWISCPWGNDGRERSEFQILDSIDMDNTPEPIGNEPTDIEEIVAKNMVSGVKIKTRTMESVGRRPLPAFDEPEKKPEPERRHRQL